MGVCHHCLHATPQGSVLFNKRFAAAWAADGYVDYLSPVDAAQESGKEVLGRLLLRGGAATTTAIVTAPRVGGGAT